MLTVRHSLLLVDLFATAARATSDARHANTGGCELIFFAAEPARIAVALGSESSKLDRKLRFVACLAIPVVTGLRRCLRLAGATAKSNCFDHLSEWEFSSPSKMLGNLRMQ